MMMIAYLIEAGNHLIIYIQEAKKYFIIAENNDYLNKFLSHSPHFESWENGKSFDYELGKTTFTDGTQGKRQLILGKNINEEEVLKRFYHPAYNPGAVIAVRDSAQEQVVINDKNRFAQIIKTYGIYF